MKNKFSLLIFSLVLMFLLGSFVQISACSCAESTPAEAYNYADAVFIGKDIGATRQITHTFKNKIYINDAGEVTFKISECFFGVKKGTEIVIKNNSEQFCGDTYQRGKKYLIYARKRENGDFWAMACSRINLASEAKEDLNFLRNILPKATKGHLSISISISSKYLPVSKTKIEIRNKNDESKNFTVETDENGKAEIEIPAGIYLVRPFLPDNLQLGKYYEQVIKEEIKIKTGGSHRTYIRVENKSNQP